MKIEILKILNEIRPEYDFSSVDSFVASGMLDSFDVVTLVTMLDESFHISIEGVDVIPANFETLDSIERLINKSLKE